MATETIINKQGQKVFAERVISTAVDVNGEPITPNSELKPYLDRIALGDIEGVEGLFKFGGFETIGTTETLIWDLGGDTYPFTKLNETFRVAVKSDNIADNVAGSGAQKVLFFYLDVAGIPQTHEVELNGTTEIDTGIDANFIYRARVTRCGTEGISNASVGNVQFYNIATPSQIHAQLSAGIGSTEMCIYRVPSDSILLLTAGSFQVRGNRDCTYMLKTRVNDATLGVGQFKSFNLTFRAELVSEGGGLLPVLTNPVLIPPNTDIIITGKMAAQSGAGSCSFGGRIYKTAEL